MSVTPARTTKVRNDVSLITDDDLFLFNEGSHLRMYDKMGAHITTAPDGTPGTYFAVWAPDADVVTVLGDFNDWKKEEFFLKARGSSGVWEGFIPNVGKWVRYKYNIHSRYHGYRVEKADPYGFYHEVAPLTASVVWEDEYEWNDQEWMDRRQSYNGQHSPTSVYELHLGSWMRVPEDGNRSMSYRELAPKLAEYVTRMGFTHVEIMPVTEHPFFGSWGYQATGYFAPTSRFGTPEDFKYLVDVLHQNKIGVILDWVPSHFPTDGHGLGFFDGTHLYEHADPQKGFHPDWSSYIFNYDRNEVLCFLYSSAMFWLDRYHIDGLRVDAVASMLYLDYSRKDGEWIPNEYGGRENIGAIEFLRRLNHEVYSQFPDVQTIAEESTDWPMVSRPTYVGGLGFGYKWDMGWMHDTLSYFSQDPVHRKYHHNTLTFRMLYAYTENYMLPLSHDEVVHGKGSLINKMPGDYWQKFANLRLLFGYMYGQPGKKLLFMGAEFGQWNEWKHDEELDWMLLSFPMHRGLQRWVQDLNHFYREQPALFAKDASHDGFSWIDCSDSEQSVISFIRKSDRDRETILFVMNFTPVPRENYRIGVPRSGHWDEVLNSDAEMYGGSGWGNYGGRIAEPIATHGQDFSITLSLPPLGCIVFSLA